MRNPVWCPPPARITTANITRFMKFVNERHGTSYADTVGRLANALRTSGVTKRDRLVG